MKSRCSLLMCLLAVGCAQDRKLPDSPSLASETLQASEASQAKIGVVEWRVEKSAASGRVSGLASDGSTLAVFEFTKGASRMHSDGFTIASVQPHRGYQERDAEGGVLHDELAPKQAAILDAYWSDMRELAAADGAASRPTFAYKDDLCSWCGAGGQESKCYGVVLICWDLDLCSGTVPDEDGLTPACSDPYPCGVCFGLPF